MNLQLLWQALDRPFSAASMQHLVTKSSEWNSNFDKKYWGRNYWNWAVKNWLSLTIWKRLPRSHRRPPLRRSHNALQRKRANKLSGWTQFCTIPKFKRSAIRAPTRKVEKSEFFVCLLACMLACLWWFCGARSLRKARKGVSPKKSLCCTRRDRITSLHHKHSYWHPPVLRHWWGDTSPPSVFKKWTIQ